MGVFGGTSVIVGTTANPLATRGRPGTARVFDEPHTEAAFLDDARNSVWRTTAANSENVFATDAASAPNLLSASISEFGNSVATQGAGGSPPVWGSPAGATFDIPQGGTLDLNHVLRFSDPDHDDLTFALISGTLPIGVTLDQQTGILTAAGDATLGLSGNLVVSADDGEPVIRRVGPGKPYATIRAAVLATNHGDIVEVDPGEYLGDVVTIAKNNITIRGVGGVRPNLRANGVAEAGKGIWVPSGTNFTCENINFYDASVIDQNGAGIRWDGNGLLWVKDCGFFNCEDGILTAGSGTVLLERCEFDDCGFGDGQSHAVYFGNHTLVTARDCYFHETNIGHEFKSRARETVLERCYFVNGLTGTASYLVNCDNGGKLTMRGCCLHKGAQADNDELIFHNTNTWGGSYNSILIEHCSFRSDMPTGVFINCISSPTVTIKASLFCSNGRPLVSGATPTQDSNYETTAVGLPGAPLTADPNFYPALNLIAALTLGAPVVPTYTTDAPHVMTTRGILSPLLIGAIQEPIPAEADFWWYPTLQDERNMYDNYGWTHDADFGVDQTFDFANPAPTLTVSNVDVHDLTEGDDLYVWTLQNRRGYQDGPQAALVNSWHQAWLTYFRDGEYVNDVSNPTHGEYQNDHDHMYGYGLVLHHMLNGPDAPCITAAEAIGDLCINEYSLNHDDTNPPPDSFSLWSRNAARWLILWTYLSQAAGANTAKWELWRNRLIHSYLVTPAWQDSSTNSDIADGGMYLVPRSHIQAHPNFNHNGTVTHYDAGRRFNSTNFMHLHAEALWRAYIATGLSDAGIRARLIAMARYIAYYGHDAAQTNGGGPFSGSWFGNEAAGAKYHRGYQGYGDPNPPPMIETATYDGCLVNPLVFGYKLTGDISLLDRAKIHFKTYGRWDEAQPAGGGGPLVSPTDVYRFVDVKRKAVSGETMLFNWDKGMLFRTYQLMENGGNPSVLA
jgi:hypothetical protein